ncbi:uncharacterized protein LOC136084552 [Hydra vulgaris]|uniref:Uncharacterized protein LOC136084552 n=1 Tax=Hydra vulgaris TaxID=6087 RepID=A0ABM4CGB0_HYDVU
MLLELGHQVDCLDEYIINDWGKNNIPGFSNTQSVASQRSNIGAQEIQQNAFNNNDNLEYQYQYNDIRYIGYKLIEEHNKLINRTVPQIIFINPLRQGKDLGGVEINATASLTKFKVSLDNNHKAVGIFNSGGNHWIAYALFKDGDQIKCYYKDSLGKICKDFEQVFKDAFYKDKCSVDGLIQSLGDSAEQNLDFEPLVYGDHQNVSCGIFALKNMLALADIDLLNPFNIAFFTPGDTQEVYNQSIKAARQELAEKYLKSRIEETKIEKLRQEVPKIHRTNEPEELTKVIDIGIKEVEVLSLPDNPEIYQYRITCHEDSQQNETVKLKLHELNIEYTSHDSNESILLIRSDQLKEDNDKIKSLLQIIRDNNDRLKQKDLQIQIDICKEISESCRIFPKTKIFAINILKSCGFTEIPDTFGTEVFIDQSEFVNKKIQNFEDAIMVAFDCFNPLGKLKVPENEFVEALYRVSWRSSEIPTKVRFGDSVKLQGTAKYVSNIGERNWVLLDYLAEALGKYQESSPLNKSFQDFYADLVILLKIIKGEDYSEAYSLLHLSNFVEEYYDNYLLQKIEQTLSEFRGVDANEFIKDSRNCYAILRASEVTSESFKNLSETEIQKIQDGEKFQQSLRQFRNALHHEILRTELLVEYNPELLKEFIKIFSAIQALISKSPVAKVNTILLFLEEVTSILKQRQLINNQQVSQVLSNIVNDDSKKEVGKFLYRLNANSDKLDEQKFDILKNALVQDKNIFKILWSAQHKSPLLKVNNEVNMTEDILSKALKVNNEVNMTEDILSKALAWLQVPTETETTDFLKVVRNLPYKLVFSKNEYEEIFKNLLKYRVINQKTLKENTQFLLKNHKAIWELTQLNSTELDNINSALDFFKEKLTNLHLKVFSINPSNDNKKIYENSISILYSQLLSKPRLIEPLIKELSYFITNASDLLNKILTSESLSPIHELYKATERESFKKALDGSYLKIEDKDLEKELFLLWFHNYSNKLSKDFLEKSKKAIVIDKDKLIKKLDEILSNDNSSEKTKIRKLQSYLPLEWTPTDVTVESIAQFKQTLDGQKIIEDYKNKNVKEQDFSKVVDQSISDRLSSQQMIDYYSKIKENIKRIVAESSNVKLYKKFIKLLKKQVNFKEKFKEIFAKELFNIKQSFDEDSKREQHFKSLKNDDSINEYFTILEKHTSQRLSNVTSEKKSPLVDRLKGLLNKLEEYIEQIQENPSELHKLSCEFIVERIGDVSEKLAMSRHFPETEYLSLSKYQLIILNASRKALAHHPLEIGDAKLRYFIDLLVLEARHKIKETIFEGNNVNDTLIEHKLITLEFLEDTKCKIQNIVLQHGFKEEFFLYSLDFGCNIGVQGDLNLVVLPIDENTKYTDLFSLELALTKFLQVEVKVFNFQDFKTIQTRKISSQHQDQLGQIEEFTTFIATEKFRSIYHSGQWISVKIGKTTHYRAQGNILETEFIQASSIDYIYTQHTFNVEREDTKKLRQDRIENVSEIRRIIEKKAGLYLNNLVHGVNRLKAYLPNKILGLLKLFLIQDKKLNFVIDKYFHTHREEILKARYEDGIINFRAMVKAEVINKGSFDLIQEEKVLQNIKTWNDLFQKLPCDLKDMVKKLEIFFYEARNPEIIEQIFNKDCDQAIIKSLLIKDLRQLFCENAEIKTTLIFNKFHISFGQVINSEITITEPFIKRHIDAGANGIVLYSGLAKVEFQTPQIMFNVHFRSETINRVKVDFASEVEYGYYQKYHQKLVNIIELNSDIFNLIKNTVSGEPLEPDRPYYYDYEVPYVSNGILGFSSELKRLEQLFIQIQSNCHARKALNPDLAIDSKNLYEMCINISEFSTPPEIKGTIRFNSKFKKLQDVFKFYGMTEERQAQISTQDRDDISHYFKFRAVYDQLKTYLLRLNKHYLEYNKLKNLLTLEQNQKINLLYGTRIDQVIGEARFDLEQIKLKVEELFKTLYVIERIKLTLQNPYKLELMLQFVNEKYDVSEKKKALSSIFQLAKQKVQKAIIVEIFKNFEVEERLYKYFMNKLNNECITKAIQTVTTDDLTMCEIKVSGLIQQIHPLSERMPYP